VRHLRGAGGIIFLNLRDDSGLTQIALKKDTLGENFKSFSSISLGDIIRARGMPFLTRTRVRTLDVSDLEIYSRCLASFPDKYHGVSKIQSYKNRPLDLLANQNSLDKFIKRNNIIREIRQFLYSRGFQEVDTGILQETTNTSMAADFVTHSNYLGRDLYLRKTPELRLKQLMVGGLGNLFELGKNFRNEGISREYHPEYTILELYQSYADYRDVLNLTINLLEHLNNAVGEPESKPAEAEHVEMYDLIKDELGIDVKTSRIAELMKQIDPEILKNYGNDEVLHKGFYVYDLFRTILKRYPKKNIILHGVPKVISVLGEPYEGEPDLTQEFRYFVRGNLICNGITELSDQQVQRDRILQQSSTLDKPLDDNDNLFLESLKFGIPPCAGIGLGIEKLLMVYCECDNIKDVIYFPL